MRLVLALTVLALASAGPVSASPEGATGGATVPTGTTGGMAVPTGTAGGMAVPGETDPRAAVNSGAGPAGGAQAGDSSARSASPPRSGSPARESAAGVRAQAPPEGQPDVPPTPEEPDEGDVNVRVPIDDGGQESGATQPTPPGTSFGGLAPTGLAVAVFAAFGVAAAAAGLGLRRLAR